VMGQGDGCRADVQGGWAWTYLFLSASFAGQRRQGSGQAQDAGWVKETRVCSDRGEAVFGLDVGTSLSQALAFMAFMRAPRGDQLHIYRRL
jgi:hypothetical protein